MRLGEDDGEPLQAGAADLQAADVSQLAAQRGAGDGDKVDRAQGLDPASPFELPSQRGIADRQRGSGVDDDTDLLPVNLGVGDHQPAFAAAGADQDRPVLGHRRRLVRVDRQSGVGEVENHALGPERIDAEDAVGAHVDSIQHRRIDVAHRAAAGHDLGQIGHAHLRCARWRCAGARPAFPPGQACAPAGSTPTSGPIRCRPGSGTGRARPGGPEPSCARRNRWPWPARRAGTDRPPGAPRSRPRNASPAAARRRPRPGPPAASREQCISWLAAASLYLRAGPGKRGW